MKQEPTKNLDAYRERYEKSINAFVLDQLIVNLYREGLTKNRAYLEWIKRHIKENQEEYDRQKQEIEDFFNSFKIRISDIKK